MTRPWHPLEASPDVFRKLATAWGVPVSYSFIDVLDLDTSIDLPVQAVILLFPDTDAIIAMRRSEHCIQQSDVLWIPQVDVGHSCGTFALVHALGELGIARELEPFFKQCRQVEPAERTRLFATSPLIYSAHHDAIMAGQSEVRDTDWDDCDHFLSFVHASVGGQKRLIELDGNAPRTGPLDRGPAGSDLLKDVSKVVRELYIPNAGDNLHFAMITLVGK